MQRTFKWLRIGLFALFIVLPLACVPLFSALAPYGRPFTEIPRLALFLSSRPGARAQLATALLERSVLRKAAIIAENSLIYYGFGYIDTPRIVSGKDGWLFLKDEFSGGRCLDRSYFARELAFADVLQDVAEAAGVRLILSVAPDKSTIYPEQLQPVARAYWACKAENAATWRDIAAKTAPRIVDHAIPVLEEKRRQPAQPLFYATDTHWTPLAAALAGRQLAAVLAGGASKDYPAPQVTGKRLWRKTDLRNAMLMLDGLDSFSPLDQSIEKDFAADFAARSKLGTTLIVSDSFYNRHKGYFQAMFPAAQFISYADLDVVRGVYQSVFPKSQTLIVESVERGFFPSLEQSWRGFVGASILERAQQRAKACVAFLPIEPAEAGASVPLSPLQVPRATMAAVPAAEESSSIPISVPASGDTLPCLSIEVNRGQLGTVEIFLPKKGDRAGPPEFEEGRSIVIPVATGTREIRIVLPAYVAGREVRVFANGAPWSAGANVPRVGLLQLEKGP